MLIKIKRGWEIPESSATPESLFLNRRELLAGAGAALATSALVPTAARAQTPDPSAKLYPAPRSLRYRLDREITDEKAATTYNNFYEFGSSKNIHAAAQALPIRPWEIRIDGMVEKPQTIAIDHLLGQMQLEERLYRHRCVEAWAMAVPWTGFPLKSLVEFAKPLGSAKFLRMETFHNPTVAFGQKASWYPWPYVEGLTIAEATNELALLVTGIYGKPVPKQMGAPLRLAVPWKYGFKSVKSIVRFNFTDQQPKTFWEEVQGSEYGFWANVNPKFRHPRWSQETEELLGVGRVPTQVYNGYGDFVAELYADMPQERKLFM
jgi:methionine sulfoxide reductase catalytic subunit